MELYDSLAFVSYPLCDHTDGTPRPKKVLTMPVPEFLEPVLLLLRRPAQIFKFFQWAIWWLMVAIGST